MEEGEEGGLVGVEEVEEVGESGECFKGKPHTRKTFQAWFFLCEVFPKYHQSMCYMFCGSSSNQILQLSMHSVGWGLGNLTRAQVPFS